MLLLRLHLDNSIPLLLVKEPQMVREFKKIGVAAAVAAALGASGAAQAITLGEPGDALLVPHVIYSSADAVNTLIGVTVGDNSISPAQFPTVTQLRPGDRGCNASDGTLPLLHYYFFDVRSVHRGDGTVPVSCNDFSRIDWGYVVRNRNPSLDGVPGYLVLSGNEARNGSGISQLVLYGSAYLIQGNWASEAFIPVLPLKDTVATDPADEVRYRGGVPSNVNPLLSGMRLAGNVAEAAKFSMRYFVDPAPLFGNTRLVLWFPDNRTARNDLPIDVFDADEVSISTTVSVPDELNIINANNLDGTNNDPGTHAIPDLAVGQPALDSGFVLFTIADSSSTTQESRAGVAFSLIGLGPAADGVQVQTDLAHERGIGGR
jgi:hypothetical protein